MSITQTYFLAHSARSKLSREAARADHDLRVLVGHATMLETLTMYLANAEQEQVRWVKKSPSAAQGSKETSCQAIGVEDHEVVQTISPSTLRTSPQGFLLGAQARKTHTRPREIDIYLF